MSSSDSEDDEQMRQFMEAADTSLLNNSMFAQKDSKQEESTEKTETPKPQDLKDVPKSQRHLAEEDLTHDFNDIIVAPQMQVHIGRKMSQIIEKQIEFITIPSSTTKTKKIKSKVKLLRDSECFVKPYEEFEDTYAGPGTRPNIKRRNIDNDEVDELRQLSEAAIEIQDINKEVCNWAKKPERKDRFFEYTQGSTGQIHAKPMVNEFTALRRKNKWSEHKIKEAIST